MPDISTVHLDQFLTNVSIAYQNATFYGRQLFPIVPVNKQTNKYPIFGKERFKVYDDSRRPGAEALERPGWRLSNDFYFCDGHAQKEIIPDELLANSDVPDIEIQTVEDLTDSIWLKHEINVFNSVLGSGTAVPVGQRALAAGPRREVFGFAHAEVGAALGRSDAAARQLAHRAREHVQARRPRFDRPGGPAPYRCVMTPERGS